jgi:hypothetical protein
VPKYSSRPTTKKPISGKRTHKTQNPRSVNGLLGLWDFGVLAH